VKLRSIPLKAMYCLHLEAVLICMLAFDEATALSLKCHRAFTGLYRRESAFRSLSLLPAAVLLFTVS
jgi:hypothetical protein